MSATQVTVTSTEVAVRYRRNVGSLSIDRSADSRTTIFDRHIDRNIGRVSVEISADISVNMSTATSRSICRSSIGRYVDRHLIDMSTDISVEGAQNTYDPKHVTYHASNNCQGET